MNDQAYSGSWLVYFNGIEVPATSAQVSAGVGQIPQATIVMPPSRYLKGLGREDRIRCTLFYLDHHAYEEPTYCLMFDGEIVATSMDTTPESIGVQFTAVDLVAVLTQIFPFFVQNAQDISKSNLDTTRNSTSVASAFAPPTSVLLGKAMYDPSGRQVSRPFDIVMNILTLSLGESISADDRSVVATQFFARLAERTNFKNRFAPSYYLDKEVPGSAAVFPILRAAQSETVLDAVQSIGDRVATSGSYYNVIDAMFNHVYCDLLMMLSPSAVDINPVTFEIDNPIAFLDKTREPDAGFAAYADPAIEGTSQTTERVPGLVQYLTKPKIFFGLPPVCNIIWPCMRAQSSYAENYARQPTRTYIGNAHAIRALHAGRGGVKAFEERALTVAYPKEAQAALDGRITNSDTNLDNFLVYPEEFFKGPVYNNMQTPSWFMYMAEAGGAGAKGVQQLYATMEHFRTRGAQKNGSQSMPLNPYIVHGFPTLIVDPSAYNGHTFADILTLTHTFSQTQMSTNVSYSMSQTIDELVARVADTHMEFFGTAEELRFAPAHPITDLRRLFQNVDNASEFYQRIFYKRDTERPGAIDWTEIFGVVAEDGVEDIDFTYGSRSFENYDTGYVPEFVVRDKYVEFADNHDEAMKFAARPVCTLDEYITFNGSRGVRDNLRTPQHPTEGKAADYYARILNLNQGPGTEPGQRLDGTRCGVLEADTRINWERRLLRYRDSIYNDLAPQRG